MTDKIMIDASTQTEKDIDHPEKIFNNNIKPRALVLSGGGMKGLAHVGALRALDELGMLKDIDTFAGTSIGALIAAWTVLGYTPRELCLLCIRFKFDRLQNVNLTNLLENFGLDNGEKFDKVIKRVIKVKTNNENITLKQLYEYNKKSKTLILTATCLEENKVYYLDHITHPDLPLHIAIRMSSSIPFYYTPVRYDNKYFIDGGCMDNYPMFCFKNRLHEAIGIYLYEDQCGNPIDNLESYTLQSIYCILRRIDVMAELYKENTIFIKLKDANALEFNMSEKKKREICDYGYNTVKNIYKSQNTP